MEGPRKLARSDPMTLGAILWHTKTGTSSSSSCVLTRASFAAAEGCIQTERLIMRALERESGKYFEIGRLGSERSIGTGAVGGYLKGS